MLLLLSIRSLSKMDVAFNMRQFVIAKEGFQCVMFCCGFSYNHCYPGCAVFFTIIYIQYLRLLSDRVCDNVFNDVMTPSRTRTQYVGPILYTLTPS